MPFFTKEEMSKWHRNPNCDGCGRFVGVGAYYELDCGEDGHGPTTVDCVMCIACAEKENLVAPKEVANG